MKRWSDFRVISTSAVALLIELSPAQATPSFNYVSTIAIPGNAFNKNAGGTLTSFDTSTYDPTSGLFFLGDRSNAGIDVFNLNNNTFVGTIGAGQFVGFTGSNSASGADGTTVLSIPNGTRLLFGGDGNSTVRAYTIPATGAANLANYSSTPAYVVNTNLPGIPANSKTGPANNRADALSYDPVNHNILVSNNAATPSPYITLFDATTGNVIAQTVFDGTNNTPNATGNSVEGSIYDAKHNVYWLSIPQIGPSASNPGGLSEIDALTGAVIATFPFVGVAACSPTGVAISNSGQVAIGCGAEGSQTLLFDTTRHTFRTVPFNGADEVVFAPAIDAFLLSGSLYNADGNPTGPITPSFGIIDDATDTLSQVLDVPDGNPHSVDGGLIPGTLTVEIGVPEGVNSSCGGCLLVFSDAQAVPEPSTLPIVLTSVLALVGFTFRRRID